MEISDYMAFYAAFLSTAIFLWNIYQTKPKIRVIVIYSLQEADIGINIWVKNTSTKPIYISYIGVMYPYRHVILKERIKHIIEFRQLFQRQGWCNTSLSYYDVNTNCPLTLEPSNAYSVFIPLDALKKIYKDNNFYHIIGTVQDALGNNYHSKKFDLQRFLQQENDE